MSERDDIAWIEGRERGEVSDHPRAASYARLGQAIAALPELSGDDGWRAAVLDEVDRGTDERRRVRAARARRKAIVAVLVSSMAIAAIAVLVTRPRATPRIASELAYEVAHADGVRRSEGAVAIGQALTIRATVAGPGELWIYRGDRLVLRCPGGDGCTAHSIRGGRRLEAVLRTDVALTYTALLVQGPVDAPAGVLQTDADRAADTIRETLTIDVR